MEPLPAAALAPETAEPGCATGTAQAAGTATARGGTGPGGRGRAVMALLPGLAVTLALAGAATVAGHFASVIGAPVIAIVAGMVVAMVRAPGRTLLPGIQFSAKKVLQAAVVVFGTGLSFRQVLHTGASSLPVMLGTLAVALFGAWLIGRLLAIPRDLRTLIGVGTGICGASAIAATDAVIDAPDADVSYAIATIFTFNVLAVLTFPTLGRVMHLGPHSFGTWAGTAINDLSSVVAASTIFGHGATGTAVVVKLTRTLMIIPIAVVLGTVRARAKRRATPGAERLRLHRHLVAAFPVFIIWFLVAVSVNTAGLVPLGWHAPLSNLAQFLITMALAAIGLSTKFRDIRSTGLKPLALGASLWILVACTSLGLQLATGTLH